jgi:hypothetical protein
MDLHYFIRTQLNESTIQPVHEVPTGKRMLKGTRIAFILITLVLLLAGQSYR